MSSCFTRKQFCYTTNTAHPFFSQNGSRTEISARKCYQIDPHAFSHLFCFMKMQEIPIQGTTYTQSTFRAPNTHQKHKKQKTCYPTQIQPPETISDIHLVPNATTNTILVVLEPQTSHGGARCTKVSPRPVAHIYIYIYILESSGDALRAPTWFPKTHVLLFHQWTCLLFHK